MNKLLLTAILLMINACGNDANVFHDRDLEEKPTSDASGARLGGESEDVYDAAKVLYKITANTNSELELCKAQVGILLKSNFSLSVPKLKANCFQYDIDLSDLINFSPFGDKNKITNLFESVGSAGSEAEEGGLGIQHDGKILSMKKLGAITCDPACPVILGPIIYDNEEYKGYKYSKKTKITGSDGKSFSGRFEVKVNDHNTSIQTGEVDKPFDNVIHWELEAKGFDEDAPIVIKKMETWYSTQPLMLPKIKLVLSLQGIINMIDVSGTDGLAGGTGAGISDELKGLVTDIVGDITVTIEALQYEAVD